MKSFTTQQFNYRRFHGLFPSNPEELIDSILSNRDCVFELDTNKCQVDLFGPFNSVKAAKSELFNCVITRFEVPLGSKNAKPSTVLSDIQKWAASTYENKLWVYCDPKRHVLTAEAAKFLDIQSIKDEITKRIPAFKSICDKKGRVLDAPTLAQVTALVPQLESQFDRVRISVDIIKRKIEIRGPQAGVDQCSAYLEQNVLDKVVAVAADSHLMDMPSGEFSADDSSQDEVEEDDRILICPSDLMLDTRQ